MSDVITALYDTLDDVDQKEVKDFIHFLISQKTKNTTDQRSIIDRFSGVLDDEDAETMLSASQECRRLEPNEW